MDPDMAEAIAEGASSGDAVFDMVVGGWKNPWFYRFDFMAWTQTNLDSGTVRALRLPTQPEEFKQKTKQTKKEAD